jgi:hypothetical protein
MRGLGYEEDLRQQQVQQQLGQYWSNLGRLGLQGEQLGLQQARDIYGVEQETQAGIYGIQGEMYNYLQGLYGQMLGMANIGGIRNQQQQLPEASIEDYIKYKQTQYPGG